MDDCYRIDQPDEGVVFCRKCYVTFVYTTGQEGALQHSIGQHEAAHPIPHAKPWNPVTHPFRVTWTRHSSQPGLYGWATDRVTTYTLLAEALDAASALFRKGVFQVNVDEALNPATWTRNGKWKAIASRKPKQPLKFTRYGWDRAGNTGHPQPGTPLPESSS